MARVDQRSRIWDFTLDRNDGLFVGAPGADPVVRHATLLTRTVPLLFHVKRMPAHTHKPEPLGPGADVTTALTM